MLVRTNVAGSVDGAIDVALGGEVDDRAGPRLRDDGAHVGPFGDVALDERHALAVDDAVEAFEVPGVGELVEHHQPGAGGGRRGAANEIAADESGAAGDDPGMHQGIFEGRRARGIIAGSAPWLKARGGLATGDLGGGLRGARRVARYNRGARMTDSTPPPSAAGDRPARVGALVALALTAATLVAPGAFGSAFSGPPLGQHARWMLVGAVWLFAVVALIPPRISIPLTVLLALGAGIPLQLWLGEGSVATGWRAQFEMVDPPPQRVALPWRFGSHDYRIDRAIQFDRDNIGWHFLNDLQRYGARIEPQPREISVPIRGHVDGTRLPSGIDGGHHSRRRAGGAARARERHDTAERIRTGRERCGPRMRQCQPAASTWRSCTTSRPGCHPPLPCGSRRR